MSTDQLIMSSSLLFGVVFMTGIFIWECYQNEA